MVIRVKCKLKYNERTQTETEINGVAPEKEIKKRPKQKDRISTEKRELHWPYQCCEWAFAFWNGRTGCRNMSNWCTQRKQSVTSLLAIQFSRYFFKHVLVNFDTSRLWWRQRGHDVDVTLLRTLITVWSRVKCHLFNRKLFFRRVHLNFVSFHF